MGTSSATKSFSAVDLGIDASQCPACGATSIEGKKRICIDICSVPQKKASYYCKVCKGFDTFWGNGNGNKNKGTGISEKRKEELRALAEDMTEKNPESRIFYCPVIDDEVVLGFCKSKLVKPVQCESYNCEGPQEAVSEDDEDTSEDDSELDHLSDKSASSKSIVDSAAKNKKEEAEQIIVARKIYALAVEEGKHVKEIAKILGKSHQFVEQCISLLRLSPKVQELIGNGLSYYNASRLVILPHEQQEKFAKLIMEKGFKAIEKKLKKEKETFKRQQAKKSVAGKKVTSQKNADAFLEEIIKMQTGIKDLEEELSDVLVSRIRRFEAQPRDHFDQAKLELLAASLKEAGQKEVITVRGLSDSEKKEDPDHDYELINGERRWRAAKIAGIKYLRARIVKIENSKQQFQISAILNFNQEGHTKVETAKMIKRFTEDYGLSISLIAQYFGKSTTWVYQHQSLLNLDKRIIGMLDPRLPREKQIPFNAAVYLSSISNKEKQFEIASEIIKNKLDSVQAGIFVRTKAEEGGIIVGKARNTSPKADYRTLKNTLKRTEGILKMFGAMSDKRLEDMFASKDLRELDKLILGIESLSESIEGLIKKIKAVHA